MRNPGIVLQDKELCFFKSNASIGKKRKKIERVTSGGVGASIPIMKGIKLQTGRSSLKPEETTYWEKTPCRFFITDTRFIALSETGGFDVSLEKVLDIKMYKDAIAIFTGNQTHMIFMDNVEHKRLQNIISLMRQADEVGLKSSDFI